jgi:hypothetical protein
VAEEVGSLTPEETAVWFPAVSALAFADGLVRIPAAGPLGFVPDELMGDHPAQVKDGLRTALGRLAALHPDALLLAHGEPWIGEGGEALAQVAAS